MSMKRNLVKPMTNDSYKPQTRGGGGGEEEERKEERGGRKLEEGACLLGNYLLAAVAIMDLVPRD